MAKPASLPRWADVGGDIVEPSSGKKDIGWIVSEQPPHSYFNWFQNLVYQWCDYLDGLTDEALTWTAAHIFQKGITVTQSTANGNGASFTGNGTGKGIVTVGGGTHGTGIHATGGATNGIGGDFYGNGTGSGIRATAELGAYGIEVTSTGDSGTPGAAIYAEKSAGPGPTLHVVSGDDDAQAIVAETVGSGTGSIAIKAMAKDSGHVAVRAEGHSAGAGSPVLAVAGHSSQSAVEGDGTSHNAVGVYGHTDGGKGVKGVNSGTTGHAGYFTDSGGSADGTVYVYGNTPGGQAVLTVESDGQQAITAVLNNASNTLDPALYGYSEGQAGAVRCENNGSGAPLNLVPKAAPTTLSNGDMWVETGTNTLKVRINGVTKTVTLT